MTARQATSTVLVAGTAEAVVDPSRILDASERFSVRSVVDETPTKLAETVATTAPQCVVLTATRADGRWVDVATRLESATDAPPVVLVTAATVPNLTGNAVATGIDAYVNLELDSSASLVDTVESAIASAADPADAGRSRRLADGASDPIFALGSDGTVVQCNAAARARFGVGDADLVGTHLDELVPAEDGERLRELLTTLADEGRTTGTVDVHVETRDGEQRVCELSVTPLDGPDGPYRRSVVVSRDLTEREQDREQLQQDRDRLEEFASVVSHDLRNPLSVAIGRLEILLEEYDDEHLDKVAEAHRRIEAIIEDTLSLALSGSTEESRRPVSLAVIATAAWDLVETGDATLDIAFDGTVSADPSRLQQLFENLFRNSVEHGSTGPDSQARQAPTIRLGPVQSIATATRATGETVSGFYVADDGPGVPVAERDEIFEYGATGTDGGTGFGLAIVKDIVTGHGWQIHVTTGQDGGACFEITGLSVEPNPA